MMQLFCKFMEVNCLASLLHTCLYCNLQARRNLIVCLFSSTLVGHDASVVDSSTPSAAGGDHHGQQHHDGTGADGAHHEEGGHHAGIHVFVAEFERVEIPFIIALWIFCASLAKIGTLHPLSPERRSFPAFHRCGRWLNDLLVH